MYKDLISAKKKDFDNALEFAKNEAAAIRTGRANPSMVQDLPVEYIGSRVTIKEVASITVPEPRTLVIQPWDSGALASAASRRHAGRWHFARGQCAPALGRRNE